MKKVTVRAGCLMFLAAALFFAVFNISSPNIKAEKFDERVDKNEEIVDLSKANFDGVKPEKLVKLKEKMKEGKKLDSDVFMEKMAKGTSTEEVLATSEDPHFRKDFPDGSFIESNIVDETAQVEQAPEGSFSTLGVTQIGGTSTYRTLRVSQTSPWGYQSFRVKIYFPLGGYAKILQAYDWYYVGAVSGVDYRGIYRASETASADAVAIQRLQVGFKGISFISKFDFRIRDGRYFTYYRT